AGSPPDAFERSRESFAGSRVDVSVPMTLPGPPLHAAAERSAAAAEMRGRFMSEIIERRDVIDEQRPRVGLDAARERRGDHRDTVRVLLPFEDLAAEIETDAGLERELRHADEAEVNLGP